MDDWTDLAPKSSTQTRNLDSPDIMYRQNGLAHGRPYQREVKHFKDIGVYFSEYSVPKKQAPEVPLSRTGAQQIGSNVVHVRERGKPCADTAVSWLENKEFCVGISPEKARIQSNKSISRAGWTIVIASGV